MTRPDPVLEKWLQEQERKLIRAQTDLVRFQQQPRRGSAGEALLFNMMTDGWRFTACPLCNNQSSFSVTFPDYIYYASTTGGSVSFTVIGDYDIGDTTLNVGTSGGGFTDGDSTLFQVPSGAEYIRFEGGTATRVDSSGGVGTSFNLVLDTPLLQPVVDGTVVLFQTVPHPYAGEFVLSRYASGEALGMIETQLANFSFENLCVWGATGALESDPCNYFDEEPPDAPYTYLIRLIHGRTFGYYEGGGGYDYTAWWLMIDMYPSHSGPPGVHPDFAVFISDEEFNCDGTTSVDVDRPIFSGSCESGVFGFGATVPVLIQKT